MSERKHTPGPWEIIGDDEVCEGVPCIDISAGEMGTSEHRPVANVCCTLDEDGDFVIVDEDRANAHLIASAPDLLEALEEVLPAFRAYLREAGDAHDWAISDRAAEAIARAQGKKE